MYNEKEKLQNNSTISLLTFKSNSNTRRNSKSITEDVRVKVKNLNLSSNCIIQRQLFLFSRKGEPVNNLQDLNEYLNSGYYAGDCDTFHLTYESFEISREEVDEAIKLLDDIPYDINSPEKAIELIKYKIKQIFDERNCAKQRIINELSAQLKNRWHRESDGNGGTYIGDPQKWHIHTDIGLQRHLKYGDDKGSRMSLNKENNMIEAARFLRNENQLRFNSGRECFNWLIYTIINDGEKLLPDDLLNAVLEYL